MNRIVATGAVIGCLLVALVGNSFRSFADVEEKSARKLPDGPLGETIKLGEELVEKTVSHPLTKEFVGNSLNCTS